MAVVQHSLTLNQLRPGFKFNQYFLLEQIGAGGQAVVWSAEDSQKRDIVAVKFSEVPEASLEQADDIVLEQQLKKLVTLRHPRILPIYDYGLISEIRYLATPYISGGSLYEKIRQGPMPLSDTLRYVAEIASALDFLHQNQIIHRDLKPANVLLDLHQESYLSDFGLARSVSNTTQALHTGRGTPPYAPPEQHKQLAIIARSDIFSFGVMIYELFTGQLPWNGEKMLGMQQLYTKVEMPDPCEINPNLPPLLKDVLRRITSADPALRPSSAGAVVKMIDYIFNADSSTLLRSNADISNDGVITSRDASILLNQKMADWTSKTKQILLSPTKFAIVELDQKRKNAASIPGAVLQFILYHSIMYGYHDHDWWMKMTDPQDKAAVAFALLQKRNEVVIARVIGHLYKDQSTLSFLRSKTPTLSARLLELALTIKNPALSSQLFSGFRLISPANTEWNDSVIAPAQGALLGGAALHDNDMGDQAVSLIAHVRSLGAIDFVIKNADRSRLGEILLEIQNIAGNLPSFVGGSTRARVFWEWINQQLTTQPARLVAGYISALLGSTLGIASQVYFTIRIANFLSSEHFSISLERGLITGFVFSLGIFIARVLVERFEAAPFLLRFGLASIAGTIGMSSALLLFNILWINAIPSGFLIPAGCFIIACSYSVGKLIPWRAVKMMFSTVAVFIAIAGTWWLHRTFSSSLTDLTPLFQYDLNWSLVQVAFTAFCVSIFMGIFGNIPSMNIQAE